MVLSIVILNYNTAELTIDCVSSIIKQYEDELKNDTFEIIIADNASQDNSITAIKKTIQSKKYCTLIANKENTGFSKGNNIASKQAHGDFLFFLNSDTQITDRGLVNMVGLFKTNEKVGILGGRLKNDDGTYQASAGSFYSVFSVILLLLGFERFGFLRSSPPTTKQVDWVSGAAMMIRKNLFDDLRGFDENIFMYLEDMELCYRAKQKGFLTYFYPHIAILHAGHGSSNRSFAIISIYKGLLYFFKKHKSKTDYQTVRFFLRLKAQLLAIFGKISNNHYLINTYEKALAVC